MTDLERVAERVEAAMGADREIDYHAHAAKTGWRTPDGPNSFSWCVGDNYQFGDPTSERIAIYISEGELPEYTASLDAAMTLAGDDPVAILYEAIVRCPDKDADTFIKALPRFVTAASLRALAAIAEEGAGG